MFCAVGRVVEYLNRDQTSHNRRVDGVLIVLLDFAGLRPEDGAQRVQSDETHKWDARTLSPLIKSSFAPCCQAVDKTSAAELLIFTSPLCGISVTYHAIEV